MIKVGIPVLALAALYLLARPAVAQEVECRYDPGPAKIKVKVGKGQLTYNNRISTSQLQNLSVKNGVTSIRGGRAMGLTTAVYGAKYRIKSKLVPASNGGYCVYFSEVQAEIGLTKLLVYIDSKYRRGTCQYNQILRHEGQHVAIFRRYAQDLGMRFRDELPHAMDRINPMLVANRGEANEILNLLQQEMAPLMNQSEQGQKRENAALDTPESYRNISAKCPNW